MALLATASHKSDYVTLLDSRFEDYTPGSSHADTAYSNNAVRFLGFEQNANIARIEHDNSTGAYWVHMMMRVCDYATDGRLTGHLFDFRDDQGNLVARFDRVSGSNFAATIYGDTTVISSSVFNPGNRSLNTYDIKIDFDDAGDISMEIFLDGSSVSKATAANTGGKDHIARMDFDFSDSGFGTSYDGWYYISELMIRDNNETTIGNRMKILYPDADGNYTDWAATAYVEMSDNDENTSIATSAVNQKQSWTLDTFTIPGALKVREVTSKSDVFSDGSSIGSIKGFLRIGGTDYENTTSINMNSPANTIFWATNPATGLEWTQSEIDALEFGIKSDT